MSVLLISSGKWVNQWKIEKSEKIGANQKKSEKIRTNQKKSGNPWATSFGFGILVKWGNIGFGILENNQDLEFWDFGKNQENQNKSEKIGKSEKIREIRILYRIRLRENRILYRSLVIKSEKIRLNRNKSEKSVSEIREINENVDLGRHSPGNQNISEKSENQKSQFLGKIDR